MGNNENLTAIYVVNDETPFVPIVSEDIEIDTTQKIEDIDKLPILPLRNTVLFPGVILPITVSRSKSLRLIEEINATTKILGTVAQKNPKHDNPTEKQLYNVGTYAQIIKVLEMPDQTITIILQGKGRFVVEEYITFDPYYTAKVKFLPEEKYENNQELSAIVESLKDITLKIIKLSNNIPSESSFAIRNIENPYFLINFLCSSSDIKVSEKQEFLEINDLKTRGIKLLEKLIQQAQLLELKNDIQQKVRQDIEKQQKEFLLQQQIKTIQEELGENPFQQEIKELKRKARKKKWSKEVSSIFYNELKKFERMNPSAAEYSVQHNYLELILDLPWNEYTKDNFDLKNARKILDEDHFGLDKVKDRIIEHLAVLKLKGDLKAPILCLIGPPGVGKTSLGRSIARALGRKYVRISLGGLHDEAEIRGHRKTYIGAMPGRIISGIKKAGSSNPVFVLDEIDKVGTDFRGDPSAALLEVLDPEQNVAFHDNYLDIDYDLSKVLFLTTANHPSGINQALLDRMEIIEIPGYITEEKLEIAKRYLIPKLIKEHGIEKYNLKFEEKALETIIKYYTRESGVRNLERKIAKVIRNYARIIASKEKIKKKITEEDVIRILGPYEYEFEEYENNNYAGVVTGLAWTQTGGEVLFVETSLSRGKGTLTITGNVGDVMKESAIIALEYVKANAEFLNINPEIFEKWNVHVHVPEGAVPKDGPSAGITMVTSIASAFTQRKVRPYIAMTGEITLRGKLLPVGGIKEKILAAKRGKIQEILLPQGNKKHVEEIQKEYLKGLTFHYFSDIKDLLNYALLDEKVPGYKKIE
ncbi:MAG: endopeptidase La [Bacteroidales bacterium]|nr:endopeptidase La [Bacteroidales bacterium]